MRGRALFVTAALLAAALLGGTAPAAADTADPALRGWVTRSPAPDDPASPSRCGVAHEHEASRSRSTRYVNVSGMASIACDAPVEARIQVVVEDPTGRPYGYSRRCSVDDLCGGMAVAAGIGCSGECSGVWTTTTIIRARLVPSLPWGSVPEWCTAGGVVGDELVCQYRTEVTVHKKKPGSVTRSRAGAATTLL